VKHLPAAALALAFWALASGQVFPQSDADAQWREAIARLARVQAMVEYFFMETGVYPSSLEEMDQAYNSRLPQDVPRVLIPKDPATNQPFTYRLSQQRGYTLSLPDPSRYGGKDLVLEAVDWGWMARLAEQRRFEGLALQCGQTLKLLATQAEMFAKDHANQFPQTLDEMMPRYIRKQPACPMSGKNYLYVRDGAGYRISCPNPELHSLKAFTYDSRKGMIVEELKPQSSGSPSPASTPAGSQGPAPR
jgi:hypothetical protein